MVIVIIIENIYASVIGNCNENFVIVIGKSITSLNIVSLYFVSCYHVQLGKDALRNDCMILWHKAKHIPTCE